MAQGLIQIQGQKQTMQQKLSPSQLMMVKLLELPVTELEERVRTELDDNPALEQDTEYPDELSYDTDSPADTTSDEHANDEEYDEFAETKEKEDREEAFDLALENIGRDDEMPEVQQTQVNSSGGEGENFVYGDTDSFYDLLLQQAGEHELTEKQHDILEYLIGSLDDDGLLRKSMSDISDELAFSHNIDASEEEIHDMLLVLQTFDPAGIGATNLQECLALQIDRKECSKYEKKMMKEVIEEHFDDFKKNKWKRIAEQMKISDEAAQVLERELKKLNPKPGAAMGEAVGKSMHQITPDFLIDISDDGRISFSLNDANLPPLKVSESFTELLQESQDKKTPQSKRMKEALAYTKSKVDAAQTFIDAVKQRQQTLYLTMKAIIQWQRPFFEDGDEASLKPMKLEDIEKMTGIDSSTISRVSNSKYAQMKWGTFPLKFFFTDKYTSETGEEMSTRKIKLTLKEIIDSEDKGNPYSDEQLREKLKEAGQPVARRTVAKYREQLGVPVARLRKQ